MRGPGRNGAIGGAARVLFVVALLAGCGTQGTPADGGVDGSILPTCAAGGASCATNGDCCSGSCASGSCHCGGFTAGCSRDDDCCELLACDANGKCSLGCRTDGSSCTSTGAECCSGSCKGGFCGPPRCIGAGGACDTNSDCCDQLACVTGTGGRGTCQPGCVDAPTPCGASEPPCCSGNACSYGLCATTCRDVGLGCTSDNQCCDGLACRGGTCRPCSYPAKQCAADGDCCAGTCNNQQCSACKSKGGACTTDADCCPRLRCQAGTCGCGGSLAACSSDTDCCDGMTCQQGHCGALGCFDTGVTPVSLPNDSCGFCCSGDCAADRSCCALTGWSCDTAHECCGSDFCNGSSACQACLTSTPGTTSQSCAADNQCCSAHCQQGLCCGSSWGGTVPNPGASAPVACGNDYCCGGLNCCNDGVPPRCTLKNGSSCSNPADCCSVSSSGGTGGGCNNGICCMPASTYNSCADNSDCCPPTICSGKNGQGKTYCCSTTGTSCVGPGCSDCCKPPSPIPPINVSGTCQ